MKVCPQCQSKYTDKTLNFCLQDGTALNEVTDEKTLVLDADSFSNEKTISDNYRETNAQKHQKTEELPRTEVSQSVDQNQSVETVVNPQQGTDSFSGQSGAKGGGISFAAGFVIGFLLLGLIGGGIYAAWVFTSSESPLVNVNKNVDKNGGGKEPRILSNSTEVKVSASSVRREDRGNRYTPELAFDGNPRTAWCEGARGAGRGQWIAFDFNKELLIKEIVIQPGYFKTEDIWRKNNRLSSAVFEYSDKSTEIFNFPNSMSERTLEINKRTKSVLIRIKDIYPGASDSLDTLISEVSFVVE